MGSRPVEWNIMLAYGCLSNVQVCIFNCVCACVFMVHHASQWWWCGLDSHALPVHLQPACLVCALKYRLLFLLVPHWRGRVSLPHVHVDSCALFPNNKASFSGNCLGRASLRCPSARGILCFLQENGWFPHKLQNICWLPRPIREIYASSVSVSPPPTYFAIGARSHFRPRLFEACAMRPTFILGLRFASLVVLLMCTAAIYFGTRGACRLYVAVCCWGVGGGAYRLVHGPNWSIMPSF